MRYPHYIRISKPGAGPSTQDPRAGQFEPAPGEVIYSGAADVQDAGESVTRGETVQQESEAVIFLADESLIPFIEDGMTVQVWWVNPPPVEAIGADPLPEDVEPEDDAIVEKVVRLDGTINVRFL